MTRSPSPEQANKIVRDIKLKNDFVGKLKTMSLAKRIKCGELSAIKRRNKHITLPKFNLPEE